jgi:hypothetical protein
MHDENEKHMHTHFWLANLKGRKQFGDLLAEDGTVILNRSYRHRV